MWALTSSVTVCVYGVVFPLSRPPLSGAAAPSFVDKLDPHAIQWLPQCFSRMLAAAEQLKRN